MFNGLYIHGEDYSLHECITGPTQTCVVFLNDYMRVVSIKHNNLSSPGIMRVLILSDSHGRKMGSYLRHLDRHIDVHILSLGQKLPSVRGYYRSELRRIQRRIPDVVLIHLGHNDLMIHNKHNPDPLFITVVFHQILEFVAEIEHDLPRCKILVSTLLPRVPGDILGIFGTGQYNRMAYRFYKMLRSQENQEGANLTFISNRARWGRINNSEPLRGYHLADGLHLNDAGHKVLATGWMRGMSAVVTI